MKSKKQLIVSVLVAGLIIIAPSNARDEHSFSFWHFLADLLAPSSLSTEVAEPCAEEKNNCPICQSNVNGYEAYRLNCSCKTAFYHKDCIDQWLTHDRVNKSCPTCRQRNCWTLKAVYTKTSSTQDNAHYKRSCEVCKILIPENKTYKFSCGCIQKYYHYDCARKWLDNQGFCPSCGTGGIAIKSAWNSDGKVVDESASSTVAEQHECCICLEDIPAMCSYRLNCSCKTSFYHHKCVNKWLKKNKTCPTCRKADPIIVLT